ncbi:hypothetical protein FB446DRAFT_749893 [Lentinula raphanica]|uniref:Uncharacterized protein n=1 Tax=Lentinula raphanica TaxID=153919 RepID=A0AA38P3Y5_9AGAR|nr:hypothetical protein FB446DRAFT_749893 [Lentinula raphanica]KAJ3835883.1 hypothetical protein F5878DRAFT_626665 [Lentinula raphanica]
MSRGVSQCAQQLKILVQSPKMLRKIPKNQQKINIETRRSTTPEKRVILVQGPC